MNHSAACVASVAFMSIMYFFTDLFGKAGSFLMLIFMVVQLAGSAGTYPLEVSGSFVPAFMDGYLLRIPYRLSGVPSAAGKVSGDVWSIF